MEKPNNGVPYATHKKNHERGQGFDEVFATLGGRHAETRQVRKLSKFTFVSKFYHISDLRLSYTYTTNGSIEKYVYFH